MMTKVDWFMKGFENPGESRKWMKIISNELFAL
jgi:hypothetical protein